jgi:SAM-dependent methyltransferase
MVAVEADVADLAPEEMERAYLEYRRACYDIVYRNAVERGVLDHLQAPVTLAEFAKRMGVLPDKVPVAGLLLDALVRYGGIRRIDGTPPRYQTSPADAPASTFDEDLLYLATEKRSFQELLHSENYAGIIGALTTEGNPVSATFDQANLPLWEEVLQAPFYRYSRLQAVRQISAAGPRLLDLACGPGFGLLELAARAPDGPASTVLGVEISPDFVRSATERTAHDPRVRVLRGDVQEPLPFLRDGFFDGAMIVGAYHFLANPSAMWDTAVRLVRPGGTFCVSYVLSRVGSYDQEIMDLRFALRRPRSYPPTRADVVDLAAAKGMALVREYRLGCWCWYAFVKE